MDKSVNSRATSPSDLTFQCVHLTFDLAALIVAWRTTFELRLALNPYMKVAISRDDMQSLAPPLAGVLLLWVLASLWLHTYKPRIDHSMVGALMGVAKSATLVSTVAIVLTFFTRHLGANLSRSFVLIFGPVSFLCLVASLAISFALAVQIDRRWSSPKRVAVLGSGNVAQHVLDAVCNAGDVTVRGLILPERYTAAFNSGGGLMSATLPILGTTRQLAEVINRECLDRIIVADDELSHSEVDRFGRVTRRMGVTVSHPIKHAMAGGVLVKHQVQYGLHFIDLEAAPATPPQGTVKRAVDVAVSLSVITGLLPVLAVIAVLIRTTSRGPILYRASRVGRGGRYFTFWKFRTMYVDGPSRAELARQNETNGHLFKMRRDPRITPVGRILRRLSLDELPQLFNVLAGDMSLVGPRPLPVEDLDPDGLSRSFAEWAEQRSYVRPGITGLWQINGRSDLPFDAMMELDLHYINNWSLGLDMRILMSTPRAVLSGRGAY